ncbi:MAG: hemin uptake protein HemP [Pirellulales bacterium]
MENNTSKNQEVAKGESKVANPLNPVSSKELLQGRRELQILHGNEVYRLTLTRTGKLILHK